MAMVLINQRHKQIQRGANILPVVCVVVVVGTIGSVTAVFPAVLMPKHLPSLVTLD